MTAGEDSVNLLDPRKVVIYRDSRGDLILKVGETSFRIAKIIRAFPITMPWRYIIFIDENGHEIGILKSVKGMDGESARILREELEKRYFIPKITKIHEIREEFGVLVWRAETDKGPVTFEITSRRDVKKIPGGRVLIKDGDGNLYEVDFRRLDRHSRILMNEIL